MESKIDASENRDGSVNASFDGPWAPAQGNGAASPGRIFLDTESAY